MTATDHLSIRLLRTKLGLDSHRGSGASAGEGDPAADSTSLEARGVGVEFGGIAALDGIELTLSQGETLGLIGPNGAGKSTLVNVLTGFQKPTRGKVWLGATDITRGSPHLRSRLGIVRTFQSTRVFAGLSVFENIEIGALSVEKTRRAARALTEGVLREAGLWRRREDPAGALSTGDAHRLGVARSLALRPRFLLLDEPAAGLNDRECDHLVELLRTTAAENDIGMLIIEHKLEIVSALSQRIQVIDEGRTIAIGSPEEVQHMRVVLDAYLGTKGASDAAA